MSVDSMRRSARRILARPDIMFNRLMGREFIPNRPDMLCIETTSVCNLECCFCPYVKKEGARLTMKHEFFVNCVEQALEMGYRRFELTPCTGDVFMDPHLFDKLEFLEQNDDVTEYEFYTNFTIPRKKDIEHLVRLRKLKKVIISIYGHDLNSFIGITKATEKLYRRLLFNLETLSGLLDKRAFYLELNFRSTRDMPRLAVSDLTRLAKRFENAGIKVRKLRGPYNNWGGSITKEDVTGLPIGIVSGSAAYKNGACSWLFTSVQVRANGIVNGCACRDVEATLRIGDLNERPLHEIISIENPAYMALIDEQQEGQFRPVCRSCDVYQSIYRQRSVYRSGNVKTVTMRDFKGRLESSRATKA